MEPMLLVAVGPGDILPGRKASMDVMVSILPKYASRIYSGRKQIEVRKCSPHLPFMWDGLRLFYYESKPVKAITGYSIINHVEDKWRTPTQIHDKWGYRAGLTLSELKDYSKGRYLVVIELGDAYLFGSPIKLADLKAMYEYWTPPMTYGYPHFWPKETGIANLIYQRADKAKLAFTR
jgi:predicted transcriptional regulator